MTKWPTKLLSELSSTVDYGVTASATQEDTGVRFLRITDRQDGTVDWNTVPFCKCAPKSIAEKELKSGDIVFARTGATTPKPPLPL